MISYLFISNRYFFISYRYPRNTTTALSLPLLLKKYMYTIHVYGT